MPEYGAKLPTRHLLAKHDDTLNMRVVGPNNIAGVRQKAASAIGSSFHQSGRMPRSYNRVISMSIW